jgi:hypothetical protein
MFSGFLHIDRLATLPELSYLFKEVLDETRPLSWKELTLKCKQRSFNFAVSFENTLEFLQIMAAVHRDDKGVKKNISEKDLKQEADILSLVLLERTCLYLQKNNILNRIFNERVLSNENNKLIIDTRGIPEDFVFIKILLFNLKIAEEIMNEKMFVSEKYAKLFTSNPSLQVKERVTLTPRKAKFFISYANNDEGRKNELRKYFKALEEEGLMEYWDGRIIEAGKEWDMEIKKRLEEAEIILLLLSIDFMNSDYIKNVEMKRAIERYKNKEVTIVPIILRSCGFEDSYLNRFQALPDGANPVEKWSFEADAYVNIVAGIRRILNSLNRNE